jgi:hypothetical protein
MTASLVLIVVAIFGQETGKLSGKITNPAGEVLADVVVILSPSGGEDEAGRRMTGPEGEFVFSDLPPGVYRLVAILPGYEDQTVEKVEVADDRETRLDFSLSLPRYSETVSIRGESPVVELAEPTPPETLEVEKLDLLPLATDRFQDAFPLLPGVVRDPEGRLSFTARAPASRSCSSTAPTSPTP